MTNVFIHEKQPLSHGGVSVTSLSPCNKSVRLDKAIDVCGVRVSHFEVNLATAVSNTPTLKTFSINHVLKTI